jgi:uncharacterized SAM-binding protein YcdF (DUF218 family)
MKKLAKILFLILLLPALFVLFTSWQIYSYSGQTTDIQVDAAIVLGAAVWGDELSPVFRERINHALVLYKSGKVHKIIFTGGQGNKDELTESAAARKYAVQNGVAENDILIEEKSHTTYENLVYAKEAAETQNLKTFLIVSDPLHLKRSMLMAKDLGMDANPSPTPTSMYKTADKQLPMLMRETYYLNQYLVQRMFP